MEGRRRRDLTKACQARPQVRWTEGPLQATAPLGAEPAVWPGWESRLAPLHPAASALKELAPPGAKRGRVTAPWPQARWRPWVSYGSGGWSKEGLLREARPRVPGAMTVRWGLNPPSWPPRGVLPSALTTLSSTPVPKSPTHAQATHALTLQPVPVPGDGWGGRPSPWGVSGLTPHVGACARIGCSSSLSLCSLPCKVGL